MPAPFKRAKGADKGSQNVAMAKQLLGFFTARIMPLAYLSSIFIEQ